MVVDKRGDVLKNMNTSMFKNEFDFRHSEIYLRIAREVLEAYNKGEKKEFEVSSLSLNYIVRRRPDLAEEVVGVINKCDSVEDKKILANSCVAGIIQANPKLVDKFTDLYIDKNDAEGKHLEVFGDILCVVDDKKNLITFNVNDCYLRNIDNCTEKMSKIAKAKNMNISASFNKIEFQMNPKMTADEGYKEWEREMHRRAEEYKKSPEYQAEMKRREEQKLADKARIMADDILIKDEVFEVSDSHRRFYEDSFKNNEGSGIMNFAIRWAKLMQAEMKKQGLTELNKELVDDTERRADIKYGMSGLSFSIARNFLLHSWSKGKELAAFQNIDHEYYEMSHILHSDKTRELFDTYKPGKYCDPSDKEYKVKEAAGILADVFKFDWEQIDSLDDINKPKNANFLTVLRKHIGKNVKNIGGTSVSMFDPEELKSMIPIIDLPDNYCFTLNDACMRAQVMLTADKFRAAKRLEERQSKASGNVALQIASKKQNPHG